MQIFLIICCTLEAAALAVLIFLIVRFGKRSAGIISQAEMIKKRRIDIDDIETGTSAVRSQAVLSDALNSIKNNMQTFLEASKENVVVLSDAIDVLTEGAGQNREGSIQINTNLKQVADKLKQQLELVGECQKLTEENADKLSEIDSAARDINNSLNETVKDCKTGISGLETCEANMDSVAKNLSRSDEILKDFSKRIEEVNKIGSFIMEMSESLNLLSLNASIEAARVGEAGRGFTVVAREMSSMAEKTSQSIESINDILASIISSSEQVGSCIADSVSVFNESIRKFDSVSDSFRSIDRQSGEISRKMGDIFGKIEFITGNSATARSRASEAYDASEHIVDVTGEISLASAKTSEVSVKMNDNVTSLSNMLSGLKKLLKQYRTSVEPAGTCSSRKIKIGVFCMLDNDFWLGVRRGIIYAKNELEALGAEIRFAGYRNWNEVTMADDFRKMMADGFDGFLCPGFMAAIDDLMETAKNAGKKVFVFNCDASKQNVRDVVFQPDTYMAGTMAAKEMAKNVKEPGAVTVLAGDYKMPVNKARCESFVDYIEKTKNLKISEIIKIDDNEEEDSYRKAVEAIKKYPDMKGMFVTTGTPLGAARAIEESGKKIKLVVFDHSQEIFRYIRKGIIIAAIGQDPFGQGYDPIVYMYNQLLTGKNLDSDNMRCRINVVDANNVESLVELSF